MIHELESSTLDPLVRILPDHRFTCRGLSIGIASRSGTR